MFPKDFIDNITKQLGSAEANLLLNALQQEPITSVRLNDKCSAFDFGDVAVSEVAWNKDGRYLSQRVSFTLDPLWHAGAYYVQEASSMILQAILEQYVPKNSIVLDLCAAPGGKSTLISQWLQDGLKCGLLVSNEVIRQRAFILSENVQKWGNGNVVVTHNKAQDFGDRLKNFFDCIVVDAPCSGEGMFRKDLMAIEEWSMANVLLCAERQRNIVEDAWDSLKEGGILIYSTCTFNELENEQNIQWIADNLGATILPFQYDKAWGLAEGKVGYHCFPHKMKGEGLYFCILQKTASKANQTPKRVRKVLKNYKCSKMAVAEMKKWLLHPDLWAFSGNERFMKMYPSAWEKEIENICANLTCLTVGIGAGELRGSTMQPQHAVSMLKDFKKDVMPSIELTKEQALQYLHLDNTFIPLTDQLPVGMLLLTYKQVPLGFCKNIGDRINNLYPKEWRIRNL